MKKIVSIAVAILWVGTVFSGELVRANPSALKLRVNGDLCYVASGTGVYLFDLSDIRRPHEVSFIDEPQTVNLFLKDNLLFLASMYNGFKVYDVSNSKKAAKLSETSPGCVRAVYVEGETAYLTLSEHIETETNKKPQMRGVKGVCLMSVKDPRKPRQFGRYIPLGGMNYGVFVKDSVAYVCCDGIGVQIVDCRNKARPVAVGKYTDVKNAYGVYLAGSYTFLYGVSGGVQILNTTNPKNIKKLASVAGGNVYDVRFRSPYLYVVSPGRFLVYDLNKVTEPKEVGKFEFEGNAYGLELYKNYALIANSSYGVLILDISKPEEIARVGIISLQGTNPLALRTRKVKSMKKCRWLRVVDGRVVMETGEPYRLVAGSMWTQNYTWGPPSHLYRSGGIRGIAEHLRRLGFNAVRLAIYPKGESTDYTHLSTKPAGAWTTPEDYVEEYLWRWVKEIEKAGMYITIDMHSFPANYWIAYEWYIPVWKAIARKFKNDPYVAIYELGQEPYFYPSDARRQKLASGRSRKQHMPGQRRWYIDCIKEIRKVDRKHIVMVESYGPWWWKIEEQWSTVNFKADPGYGNVVFSCGAAYGNGFSEAFRRWATGIMDRWGVVVGLREIETGGRYNKPEDWWYFIYGWLSKESRTVPLQFWAYDDEEAIMADIVAPFAVQYASPPPPPRRFRKPQAKARVILRAENAQGGTCSVLEIEGKKHELVNLPKEAPAGSSYYFELPRKLPVGRYRITVKLYCPRASRGAYPQMWFYVDSDGRQYPPDKVINWGEDHYYYVNHFVIPIFRYHAGMVEWSDELDTLSDMTRIVIKKVRGLPYQNLFERDELGTRPISQIVIERLK